MADAADPGDVPGRDPHAAIVAELRARFGDAPAGAAVAIYLAARGYDPARVAAVLARLAGHGGAGPDVPTPDVPTPDVSTPTASGGDAGAGDEHAADPAATAGAQSAELVTGGGAEPQPRQLRAWAPHERARFTPDAWGRLLQLRAAGLGDHEFEHLVDRALLQLDGPVTLPELRALLGDALGAGDAAPPTLH